MTRGFLFVATINRIEIEKKDQKLFWCELIRGIRIVNRKSKAHFALTKINNVHVKPSVLTALKLIQEEYKKNEKSIKMGVSLNTGEGYVLRYKFFFLT